ncbi:MAG: hypothetical protein EHM41_18100 [Chloroflexi bacterium]|nr:MAG: hypothetical protein EHM41_18100 [Chloroflexota bacterium]
MTDYQQPSSTTEIAARRNSSLALWLKIIASAAFLLGLAAFALMGSYMRYSGDDYCYGAVLVRHGFWSAQWHSYIDPVPYNGNRFSLTFFSGLSQLAGPFFNGVLPGFAILLGILGVFLVLRQIAKIVSEKQGVWEQLLPALAIIFFVIQLTPDPVQSLYWRSGMLVYFGSLTAGIFLLALILNSLSKKDISLPVLLLIFLTALIAGGFSEVGTAVQASLLIMMLGSVLFSWVTQKRVDFRKALPVIVGLLGTFTAVLLLWLSPSNDGRFATLPPRPGVEQLFRMILDNTIVFTHILLKQHLVTFLFVGLFSTILFFEFFLQRDRKISWIKTIIFLVLIPVVSFLLVSASMLPNAYVEVSYPPQRTLIIPTFILVSTVFAGGIWAGSTAAYLLRSSGIRSVFAAAVYILIAVGALYPLFSIPSILSERARYQRWAEFWDARDHQIRVASQGGIELVEVVQIDHLISDVSELSPDENNWYNNCAEEYYKIQSLIANQPGWDD